MNVIGKILGLIAILFIILLIVNIKTILPIINKFAFNGLPVQSAQRVSDSYIAQIESIYPIPESMYSSGARARAYTYGNLRTYTTSKNIPATEQQQARIVAEKINTTLIITTANVVIPKNLESVAHIWIANTPTITDATTYVDVGVVKNGGIQTYKIDVGPTSFSLKEYQYVMIVNPSDFSIYSQASLQ
jgi:hypothetical protein